MLKAVKEVYKSTPRIVKFIIFSEAIVIFAYEIINPYMAIYFKELLRGSELEFGIYNSIFYFLMLIGSFFTLYLPQISSKTYLNLYYIYSSITVAVRGLTSNTITYGIGKSLQSIPGTIGSIIPEYIILSATSKRDIGKLLNVNATFSGVFLFVAPLIGKYIIDNLGYGWLFAVSSLLFLIPAVLLNTCKFDFKAFENNSSNEKVSLHSIIRIEKFFLFFLAFALRFFPIATFSLYLSLFLKDQKMFSLYNIAIYFAVVDFLTVLFQIPSGIFVDKVDKRVFIFLDGITDAIFAFICLYSDNKIFILLGAFMSKLFNIPGATAFSIMMRNMFPQENLRQILSLSASMRHLSLIVGPTLGGYLISNYGYQPIFYLIIAGSLIYSIISFKFSEKSTKTQFIN